MKLIPLQQHELDDFGLISLPWLIRDPENTRYLKNTSEFFRVQYQSTICGFMVTHRSKNKLYVDYLLLHPNLENNAKVRFYNLFLKDVTSITTYSPNTDTRFFSDLDFEVQMGQQWLEGSLYLPDMRKPNPLQIEQLQWPNDYDTIRGLYENCFPRNEWGYLEDLKNDFFSKTITTFLLKKEDEVVGFWLDVIYFQETCFVCWLGVLPKYRRVGYASQILYHGARFARERHLSKITLLVRPDNMPAVAFYKKHGFQKIWQRIHLLKK